MLVRKINPDWHPAENPGLKVGETIEKTDPKRLILEGNAEAVTKDGTVISAYELYGVIIRSERKEFEEFMQMKKMQANKTILEKEAAELKAQLEANKKKTATEVATKGAAKTATEAADKKI